MHFELAIWQRETNKCMKTLQASKHLTSLLTRCGHNTQASQSQLYFGTGSLGFAEMKPHFITLAIPSLLCMLSVNKTVLTEVLERLFNLLVCESQNDFWWQQRGVQPVVIVISKHTVCSKSVVGLAL